MELNQLYHGDCLELMKEIPDKSIDMILCDLPYGTTACSWDTIIPFELLWEQYKRIIKDNGAIVLTASQPFTSALVMSNPKMFKYEWIWEKNYSGGFILANKQPMKYHENILVFSKSQTVYNPIYEEYSESTISRFKKSGKVNSSKMQNVNYINEIQGITRVTDEIHLGRGTFPKSIQKISGVPNCTGTRINPTQKPVPLFEYLIKTYTNEGETVLDNCSGSGTTAIACINIDRNYICIELDKNQYEQSVERVSKHVKERPSKEAVNKFFDLK